MINGERADPRLRELLVGTGALRVLTLVWSTVVTIIDARSGVLERTGVAFGGLLVMAAWTAWWFRTLAVSPTKLTTAPSMAIDLGVAMAVTAADAWVYAGDHPQSYGSAWPIAAVLSIGATAGMSTGALAGLALGVTRIVAAAIGDATGGAWLALTGSVLLAVIAGVVAGYVSGRLRRAESEVALARAREEFARDLHDGVLQTLAVIQRRSDDDQLVALAREQDRELRAFIGDTTTTTPLPTNLVADLQRAAARVSGRELIEVNVVVIDAPDGPDPRHEALVAAVGEALTNAAKHGRATVVTVCVDADEDTLTVTINDDGVGFDPVTTTEGVGLTRSIRGRLNDVGGTATVRSRPGHGTEVELRVPTSAAPRSAREETR